MRNQPQMQFDTLLYEVKKHSNSFQLRSPHNYITIVTNTYKPLIPYNFLSNTDTGLFNKPTLYIKVNRILQTCSQLAQKHLVIEEHVPKHI